MFLFLHILITGIVYEIAIEVDSQSIWWIFYYKYNTMDILFAYSTPFS